jgi:hypothetical protein
MNAFTSKPDVSAWATAQRHNLTRSKEATKAIAKAPNKFAFVIDPSNPATNPLATLAEIKEWKQKQLSRIKK